MILQQKKSYTYEEYLKISENERCEYINGEIYMMSSPSVEHQDVVLNVANVFKNFFKGKECKPYIAPLDVTFIEEHRKHTVQPDVFVVCDKENIVEGKYIGIPTLVVEVASPFNSSYDYVKKLHLYKKFGVKEYWIINPMEKDMICYTLDNGNIIKCNEYLNEEDVVKSLIFEGLEITLREIF